MTEACERGEIIAIFSFIVKRSFTSSLEKQYAGQGMNIALRQNCNDKGGPYSGPLRQLTLS